MSDPSAALVRLEAMSNPSAALVRLVAAIFREAVEDVSDIVQYILGMHYRPNRVRTLRITANYPGSPAALLTPITHGRIRPRRDARTNRLTGGWGYLQ